MRVRREPALFASAALVLGLVTGVGSGRAVAPTLSSVSSSSTIPTVVANPPRLALDDAGRLTLSSGSPQRGAAPPSLRHALDGFAALPGLVSVLVLGNGEQKAAINPSAALAVGSGFKLAVLAELQAETVNGRRSWSDVVELQPGWKSLLGSVLHDWPDGSPITLHTLATLMIAGSDNSAADSLIHVLGREAVEGIAPNNHPFLTTRETFVLRSPANAALLRRYRLGDERAQRSMLTDVGRMPLPDPSHFTDWPLAPDIEWHFSAGEMCGFMADVAQLPIVHINPGPAQPDEWVAVAYKGGVDTGALSHTSWLQANDGTTYCVAAIWNDSAATDQRRFLTLYSELIDALEFHAP